MNTSVVPIKISIVLLLSFSRMASLSAQDIQGVQLGTRVNDEFIQQKFGFDYKWDGEYYVFGDDSLMVDKNNILCRVKLHSTKFAVNINNTKGGIRVGQSADQILSNEFSNEHIGEWEGKLYFDPTAWFTLGYCNLNNNREVSDITLYDYFGDDVEGIGVGERVTHDEIVQLLGIPDSIDVFDEGYGDWELLKTYEYFDGDKESSFTFTSDFRLRDYFIQSPRFKTFIDEIPDGLRVGDKIEKASNLFDANGRPHKYGDDFPYLEVEDGIVTAIMYHYSL